MEAHDAEDADILAFDLAGWPPATVRAELPSWLAAHMIAPPRGLIASLEAVVRGWSDGAVGALVDALARARQTFAVHRRHPRCVELARVWSGALVRDPAVEGVEALAAAIDSDRPAVVVSNHLAYFDTPATDEALRRIGRPDLGERLIALAGPKVYGTVFRTIITSMVDTLSVPQSVAVRRDGHGLGLRALADAVRRSLALARSALDDGRGLLLYAEGTRTRDGRLQPFLHGAARYVDHPGALVVPLAISGTERIMPVGSPRLRPARITLRFGPPIDVDALGGPRDALEAAWRAIAGLLPTDQRPLDPRATWR